MTAWIKTTANFILTISLAIALCDPAGSTDVIYSIKCKSNDANSTLFHESSVIESRLEDNGNTLGYQAGAFNYLQKGRIEFVDLMQIRDGHNYSQSDSLVSHNMMVYFEGEKSISEFFARGFFPDSRAIYSKKAIRFEESMINFSKNSNVSFYDLRNNYSSKQIQVNAKALMGPNRERNIGYDFAYNATIANGVIQTRDTVGWTDRTAARRTEWEQMALIKGNITIDNNLLVSSFSDLPWGKN